MASSAARSTSSEVADLMDTLVIEDTGVDKEHRPTNTTDMATILGKMCTCPVAQEYGNFLRVLMGCNGNANVTVGNIVAEMKNQQCSTELIEFCMGLAG